MKAALNRAMWDSMLFLSSFASLFALLAIRFTTPYLRVSCAALTALGMLCLCVLLWGAAHKKTQLTMTPTETDDKGPDVSGYLATYLMPLLVLTEPTVADQVAYGLFLIIAGVIYVRSRMVQINPSLYLLGYRLLSVTQSTQNYRGYVLLRGELKDDAALTVVQLRDRLFLAI